MRDDANALASTAAATALAPDPTQLLGTLPAPCVEYVPANATGLKPQNASAAMVGSTGSGVPHENKMPALGLTYIIALTGNFPQFN